jgi:hypothetical protein
LQKIKIILKITVFSLCLTSNLLLGQNIERNNYVTIQTENKSLREVLLNLTSQTSVKFVYSDDLVKNRKVSCNFENVSLETALKELLKTINISYTFISEDALITLYKNSDIKNQTKDSKVTIRGKVIDKTKNVPLPYANVFLANTTIGDVSDDSGDFLILNITPGSYELIISMMGYETQKKIVQITDSKDVIINFELTPKVLAGEKVTITTEDPKDWKKNLKILNDVFFGLKDFSKKCNFLNPEYINIEYDEDLKEFKAFSDELIRFENKALGYEVTFELKEFLMKLEERNKRSIDQAKYQKPKRTSIVQFYKELIPKNKGEMKKWRKNRLKAYRGSQRHFFKSLFNGKLSKEGFEIYNSPIITHLYDDENLSKIKPEFLRKPSVDDSQHILSFPDYLMVIYKKEKNDVRIARNEKFIPSGHYNPSSNAIIGRMQQRTERETMYQISWLRIIKGKDVFINPNGLIIPIPDSGNLAVEGYWIWDSPAEWLPYNYQPVKE